MPDSESRADMHIESPDAHEWWPYLSISAKHAVLETMGAPLPEQVRDEIHTVAGLRLPEDARLNDADLGFIGTQNEPVD